MGAKWPGITSSRCFGGTTITLSLIHISGYRSVWQLILLVTLINLCATPVWAIVTSYINERFPTGIRATGYGVGYSAATIIPAFSSFYMLGLKRVGMPYEYTQIVILAAGGFLLLLGALTGPETNQVELS